MPKFKVLSNLKHNGDTHKLGDVIELTEKVGGPLVDQGVLEDASADAPVRQPKPTVQDKGGGGEGDKKGDGPTLPTEEEIKKMRTKADLIEAAGKLNVEVLEDMKVDEMKEVILESLKENGAGGEGEGAGEGDGSGEGSGDNL